MKGRRLHRERRLSEANIVSQCEAIAGSLVLICHREQAMRAKPALVLTLLCLVDQHVSLQLVGVREIAGTKLALVGPLASVDPDVSPEVGHLDKLPVAVGTTIRLLPWEISVM